MQFPNPVSFQLSQSAIAVIAIFGALALVAVLVAIVLIVKDKTLTGVVVGVAAGALIAVSSAQWAAAEQPYLKNQEQAQSQIKQTITDSGAKPLFNKLDVRTGHSSKFGVEVQGQVIHCQTEANDASKPIQINCENMGGGQEEQQSQQGTTEQSQQPQQDDQQATDNN